MHKLYEIKIEPMLDETKNTGRQVVEIAVTAHVLSTRSGMQKKLTSPQFKGNQLYNNNSSIGQFITNPTTFPILLFLIAFKISYLYV